MSFFRLRSFGGNRWPALPESTLGQVWAAYLTLDRTQWLSPAEIEQRQMVQLRALLEHCVEHVPYYRNMLKAQGIVPDDIRSLGDLRRLPLVSRHTWQEQFDQFRACSLPVGTVALDEDNSSGSSGAPVRILKTNVFYIWWLAFYLRDLEWSGLNPSRSMAAVRVTLTEGEERNRLLQGVQKPCWLPVLQPLLETGPLYAMELGQQPLRQIDWLAKIDPDYFLSHASNLDLLAGMLLDEPRRFPRLRAIQSIAETLTEEAQAKIESAFGVPVKNLYSCAEAGYLASPCPEGDGLHVHSENVVIEVLDDADQPCESGATGRVVLTVLHNFLTPFLRYDIGDYVTLAPRPCRCGRGLPLLTRVLGKQRPMFRLPHGRLKHSSDLVHSLSAVGGHYQHQAIQKSADYVVIRIVPNKAWTSNHAQRLREAVEAFFESALRVDVEITERLELPPNGKLQSMICEAPRQS